VLLARDAAAGVVLRLGQALALLGRYGAIGLGLVLALVDDSLLALQATGLTLGQRT
jgi:hypothetical protein